jgi:hypothetical protein
VTNHKEAARLAKIVDTFITQPVPLPRVDRQVPCVVCGRDCPEIYGVCPGPLDGSFSDCEREAVLARTHPMLIE